MFEPAYAISKSLPALFLKKWIFAQASATMKSWVWHFWSKTREGVKTRTDIVPYTRKVFQNCDALFVPSPDGVNSPIYPPRDNEPYSNKRKLRSMGIFVDDPR